MKLEYLIVSMALLGFATLGYLIGILLSFSPRGGAADLAFIAAVIGVGCITKLEKRKKQN